MQIDELLHRIDAKESDLARMTEEKEQELAIMQEGMDETLQQLSEMQMVRIDDFIFRWRKQLG